MLKNQVMIFAAAALLVGCSQEPEPASTVVEDDSTAASPNAEVITDSDRPLELERLAEDPDSLREAMRDPEQRDALMEAMRERRAARQAARESEEGDVERTAMRERMRERRAEMMAERGAEDADPRESRRERMLERSRWWSDEDLQSSIGLDEAQAEALTQAQLEVEEQRQSLRQELGEQQQGLIEAVREADRSTLLDLIERRARTQQSLQDLELEWWRIMIDELSDEQLATLAEENPRILMRQGRR